jgi:hypothetical protein
VRPGRAGRRLVRPQRARGVLARPRPARPALPLRGAAGLPAARPPHLRAPARAADEHVPLGGGPGGLPRRLGGGVADRRGGRANAA